MRTSGPHSRDSPVDLGKLRQKSGYEPQFTQIEWDALTNAAAIVFVPMVCTCAGIVPAIEWSSNKNRAEDPHFTIAQNAIIDNLASSYGTLSKTEKKKRISALAADTGEFTNLVDIDRRRDSIQRAVWRRANKKTIEKLEDAGLTRAAAEQRNDQRTVAAATEQMAQSVSAMIPEEEA